MIFTESNVINGLPRNAKKVQIGKKYFFSDFITDLKEYVEEDNFIHTGTVIRRDDSDDRKPFVLKDNDGNILYASLLFPFPETETKWIPYPTLKIMFQDLEIQDASNFSKSIYLKYKKDNSVYLITGFDFDNEKILVEGLKTWFSMKELFDNFTHLNGYPCGIACMVMGDLCNDN